MRSLIGQHLHEVSERLRYRSGTGIEPASVEIANLAHDIRTIAVPTFSWVPLVQARTFDYTANSTKTRGSW